MDNIHGALILTVVVLVLAACAAPAMSLAQAKTPPGTQPSALPHEAPELEAVLPRSIQGRPIATWSLAGASWPAFSTGQSPDEVARMINDDLTSSGEEPVDFENLALAIGGRSNTETDPPYFVWAAKRPIAETETELSAFLMFAAAGFTEPATAGDLERYDARTIGGKSVYVGPKHLVRQDEHQRGVPYLYQNDDYMFLILTEDPAWAEEALAALP